MDVSDQELVADIARGDASAVGELFLRHGDRVYRLIVRLRGVDAKDIEDLVQATFLEMQRSAWRFDNRATVATWLLGIALNVRRHHVRAEARRSSFLAGMAPLFSDAHQRDPHDQVAYKQSLERLEAGIGALPDHLRIVLILTDIEEIRGRDVARMLRIPEGTVWRRLYQARLRLRALLSDEVEP